MNESSSSRSLLPEVLVVFEKYLTRSQVCRNWRSFKRNLAKEVRAGLKRLKPPKSLAESNRETNQPDLNKMYLNKITYLQLTCEFLFSH